MSNVWGGIHRREGRPRRGGAAVEGSNVQTLQSCHCNQPGKKKVAHLLKVTRSDWFELFLFHLDSCITVVRGDYSVLNKDKID